MKKLMAILCLLLCAVSLFAGVKAVVNVKPYFTFDKSPAALAENAGDLTTWSLSSDWWETRQDYLLRTVSKPSMLDLGFVAETDHFNIVFLLDVCQDYLQNLKDSGQNKTNIPFVGAFIDLNFPRVGYVEFKTDDNEFYASIGRRQIKWGPSTYDMAISDSQPYLDNFYAEVNAPLKNDWNFWYSFTGIAYRLFMNYTHDLTGAETTDGTADTNGVKSTFAHRFGFESDHFRIAIAELNNVYDKYPTLLDVSPLAIWHNGYQDEYSNVMLNVALEAKVGPVRAFGTFTMDDFDLPHEVSETYGLSCKPQAMGFTAGVEFNLFDGEPIESSDFDLGDYAIKEKTFKEETGLNIGYEFYYCSTFMYNRKVNSGKFTMPFQFISLVGSGYCYDENAFYLGFPYGPNTLVHRFYAEYTNNPFKAYASAELIKRGSYLIEGPYGDNSVYYSMGLQTMKLTDPIVEALKVTAGLEYYLDKGFKANAEFGLSKDLTHGTSAISAKVGASIALCEADWKNLF